MRRSIATLRVNSSILVLAAMACPAAAFAQDTTAASANAQCADLSTAEERARCAGEGDAAIVVTGSRIRQPELSSPNPLTSLTSETIEQSGETNLTDLLATTPALVGSQTTAVGAGNASTVFGLQGLNALDLRNLGLNRTLILVDGRRHVGGDPVTGAVDIGSIPTDLIERVDVLTGGASAIYGADAVAGVVNFVLKRDFEGIRARGQIGITDYGAGEERFGSIVAGHNFADGRGNIAVAYEYSASENLRATQRPDVRGNDYSSLQRDIVNDVPDNPNRPDLLIFRGGVAWMDSSSDGAIDLGEFRNGVFVPGSFDGIPEFTGSGTVYDRGNIILGGGLTIGGSGTRLDRWIGDILPDVTRHNVNMLGTFEFSPAFRLFADGKYSRSESLTIMSPHFDFFTFLAPDNVFLRQRFGAQAAGGALLSRDNFDYGLRQPHAVRDTYRGVIGAEGSLSDHLRYELSYVYGRSDVSLTTRNDRIEDRYYAAIDAVVDPRTGQPTCRVNLDPAAANAVTFQPGQCVPLNVLGENVASQAAIDFVTGNPRSDVKITQNVASAHLTGDLGFLFELPGGPIGFAVGAEYRKEASRSVRDPLEQNGQLFGGGRFRNVEGEYNVKEAFAEVSIPFLRDLPFAHILSAGAAVRFSDYSTAGNTVAWKVDGVYAPVPDIAFRGTYAQAVRAPNIFELFAPQATTFASFNDPCDIENRTSGSTFRPANCQAALAAAGLTPAQIAAYNPSVTGGSQSRPGLFGGNPDLIEETAKTWTAGVVLRPRFLGGFTATVDWYDIRIEDAISTASAQDLVNLCVDQPTLNNIFCQAIGRQQGTGFINRFLTGPANVARFDTEGLDLTLNYRFTPSPSIGTFNLRVVGGYLHKLNTIATPGAQVLERQGNVFSPKYSGTVDLTWNKGPLTVNYGLSWFSHTRRVSEQVKAAQPDRVEPGLFWFKERWTHDIRVAYDVDDRFTIYGGVNDFTAQKPEPASRFVNTYPATPAGRFLYVGAKVKLGGLGELF